MTGLYTAAVTLWACAAFSAGAGWPVYAALAAVALQMVWQVGTLDIGRPANCLERFKSNRLVGWLLFTGLVVDMVLVQAVGRL